MINADKFEQVFGIYATELWAKPEKEFLEWLNSEVQEVQDVSITSAEPERLTDDDFETIRIHLNAQKEKLCNQQRWEEAKEYQRIIDRFMAFVSAESEVIRCKDCKHWYKDADSSMSCEYTEMSQPEDGFCNWAERRGEQE